MSVETEIPCYAKRKEMTFPVQNVSDYPTEFPEIHTLPSRRVSRPSHSRSPSAHNRLRFLPLRFSYNRTEKPAAATTRHHPPVFLRTGARYTHSSNKTGHHGFGVMGLPRELMTLMKHHTEAESEWRQNPITEAPAVLAAEAV